MPIRITGMNSGLDVDTIVKEMVSAQKNKVNKLKKEQTKLQWKQDAWKDLNSRIYKLFNATLNDMRFESAYKSKSTKSSSSAVSVITGKDAMNGVHELLIEQQAKSGTMTGGKLTGTGSYTGDTKMSAIDPANFGSGQSGTFNVTVGGKTTAVTVDGNSTLSDVLSKLRGAGVDANFDEKNQRFFIGAKQSGAAGDFSITASNAGGEKAMEALGIKASLASDPKALAYYKEYAKYYDLGDRTAALNGMRSMIDQDIASRVAAYAASNKSAQSSITGIDKKVTELQGKEGYLAGKGVDDINAEITAKQAEIDAETDETRKAALKEDLKKLETGLAYAKQEASYGAEKTRLQGVISDNNTYITTDADGNSTANAKLTQEIEDTYYARAEYAKNVMTAHGSGGYTGSAKRVGGQDAKITLNGAEYESTSNVFEINGLTITVLAETADKITITTGDDTDGIYNKVKNFIKEYNALINDMDKLYNAETAKGYQPLTAEEKESMSESEVEEWEKKIKDSIMRRDETVGTVSSAIKDVMLKGVEINGKKMFLSDFGINTMEYMLAKENEKNAYHIDNDPDDPNSATNPDKLKGLISTDPDTVAKFFSTLTDNLYKTLDKLMGRTEYSSFNTIYNDKLMKEQYDDYESKIKAQEKKVTALENKWYAKFSAMETALARMQSNQSAISGLLGG